MQRWTLLVTSDSKNGGGPGEVYVRGFARREGRRIFFSVFLVLFSKLFFIIFLKLFLSRLGPFLDPMLGLCWELFGAFFALKLRSYLKVVFSSIFHRSWTPLEPQKVSSRAGENQKINILHLPS